MGDGPLDLSLVYDRRYIDLVFEAVCAPIRIHPTPLGVAQLSLKVLDELIQVSDLTLKQNQLLGLEQRRASLSIPLGLVIGVEGLRDLVQEVETFYGWLARSGWGRFPADGSNTASEFWATDWGGSLIIGVVRHVVVAPLEIGDLFIGKITASHFRLNLIVDLVSPFDFRRALGVTGRLSSSYKLQTWSLEIKHEW